MKLNICRGAFSLIGYTGGAMASESVAGNRGLPPIISSKELPVSYRLSIKKMAMLRMLSFIVIIFLPYCVIAAGFDCSKSHTFIEKAICNDKQLSRLDDELADAYKNSLYATSDKNGMRENQRKWLEKSRNLCQDKACLVRVYEERIKELGTGQLDTYNYTGTSWRSMNSYNDVVEFREGGIVAFKTNHGISYGQWKVENGVIRFDKNNFLQYEAKIDGDILVGQMSNRGLSNYSSVRWYRADNEKISQMMKKDLDQPMEDIRNAIEASRQEVLNESPETEALMQKGKGEQYGGKHWLSLCDPGLRIKIMQMANKVEIRESELCYSWYGTRHDWKETILKEGCKGRCRP